MKISNAAKNESSNSTSQYRIGVIGFGRMGMMHGALFNSLEDSTLVAVMDLNDFPAKQFGVINPSVSIYKTVEGILDEANLDAVLISTPVSSHVEIALKCVERGIPFLLEKPFALSAEEAEPLLEKLKEQPVNNMISYVYRYQNSFVKGKEILDSNCLGKIHRVTSHVYISQFFQKGKGWRFDPSISGGGVLVNNGSHVIDLLTWYFGPVTVVNGHVISVYTPGIDDFAHLILKHKSEITSFVDCSWSVRFKRKIDIKIDILGQDGSLTVSDDTIQLFLDKETEQWPAGKTVFTANDLYKPVPVDIGTPKFTSQNQHFIDCLKSGNKPTPDIFQAYHVQQITDAGYLSSSEDGKPVIIHLTHQ